MRRFCGFLLIAAGCVGSATFSSILYLAGQSLGGAWGMLTFALEPALRAGAFVVTSGTLPSSPCQIVSLDNQQENGP